MKYLHPKVILCIIAIGVKISILFYKNPQGGTTLSDPYLHYTLLPSFSEGAHVEQQHKEVTSEFSGINDLPPTEEVSDNELETLDELDQVIENPKSDKLYKQTSDNIFPPQSLSSNHCRQIINTFSQSEVLQQRPSAHLLLQGTENLDSDNCAQKVLTSDYNRPSQQDFPLKNVFSPHSPVSSPELNDLAEDIRTNSPTAFAAHRELVRHYPPSNIDTDNQDPNQPPSLQHTSVRSQQYPQYFDQNLERNQQPYQEPPQSPYYKEKDRYTIYTHPEVVSQSPDRRSERSGSYKSYSQPSHRPYYNRSGSDSDLDNRCHVSPERDNSPSQFDRGMMARDRHTNNHRSTGYNPRDQKARNYLRDNENDHYEANSKHGRRERSMSSDRTSYQRDGQGSGTNMTKKKDKKSKKSKKNKKEKKSKDYRSSNRKGGRGDDDGYDDMDGSPVSSDPEIETRDTGLNYRQGNRHRNRSGTLSIMGLCIF